MLIKFNYKYFYLFHLVAILFLSPSSALAKSSGEECKSLSEIIGETTASNWLEAHNSSDIEYSIKEEVSDENYYELGPQKLPLAVRALKSTDILEINDDEARNYTPHYQSVPNTKPFLVRAEFANFTGKLSVYRTNDGALLINHNSLGRVGSPLFTPLVINLHKKPKNLILELGGAL